MRFTVNKIINKFMIAWNIKLSGRIPIYYIFHEMKYPNSYPFFIIDIDKKRREWFVSLFIDETDVYSGTINDVTGDIFISKRK